MRRHRDDRDDSHTFASSISTTRPATAAPPPDDEEPALKPKAKIISKPSSQRTLVKAKPSSKKTKDESPSPSLSPDDEIGKVRSIAELS